jgi:hypothetical protein
MEDNNDINKYYNDINGILSFIKSSLSEKDIPKRAKTEKYVIIIDYLNELFETINCDLVLSNNIIRHIIVYGDISPLWQHEIIIYFNNDTLYFPNYIEKIAKLFKLKNVIINEKNDKYIKFILNIMGISYHFIIKKKDIIYTYFFEINKLEYNITKNLIVNVTNNKTWKINDENIQKLRNLNFLSELKITNNDEIVDYLSNNSLIIFELFEMLLCFPNYFTIVEIKNFFINFNQLLHKKKKYAKNIKKSFNGDDDLVLYKELIKFLYNLEENELFNIFIRYIINNHDAFIDLITNVDIDKELFKMFDVYHVRDLLCLLIFQYLIFKKRKIFKKKLKNYQETNDLLDVFMNKHLKLNNDSDLILDDSKIDFMDFGMLDKHKFTSLKYLKETAKKFSKFEDIIKLVSLKEEDEQFIKNFYNINMLLFTDLKNISKHHSLKIAYIIRRFHFTNKKLLSKTINFFNSIIKYKKYNESFLINENFINIIISKKLNNYIFKKMTLIPKINENFKKESDCIDIMDFQDTFILFIEFIYKNKLDYSEDDPELLEWFDTVFEASLCDMRSYRIFKNEKRKKKEKKIKKEKKLQKEIKKNKYKIVQKTTITETLDSDSSNPENSESENSNPKNSNLANSETYSSIINSSNSDNSETYSSDINSSDINSSNSDNSEIDSFTTDNNNDIITNNEYDEYDEDDELLENFLVV